MFSLRGRHWQVRVLRPPVPSRPVAPAVAPLPGEQAGVEGEAEDAVRGDGDLQGRKNKFELFYKNIIVSLICAKILYVPEFC